jgi:DNA-binding transcriptional regulator YdaS (Cro superfamily)
MHEITTVDAAIAALGGVYKAAGRLGERPSTVGNWKTRNRIPPEHFLTVTKALSEAGKQIAPDVFGLKVPSEAAE